jgi:hypothetical protein
MATTAHSDAPTVAHDGLAAELLARRRKKLPKLTAALALAVVVVAAGVGGAEIQRHWGGASASTVTPARAGGFRGFGGGGGGGGGGAPSAAAGLAFGGAGNATTGTVTLIKGTTLYVTAANGNTVLVHTSASSKVTKSVAGTVKSVQPGESVTVTGTQQKDGSVAASQITIGGATNG